MMSSAVESPSTATRWRGGLSMRMRDLLLALASLAAAACNIDEADSDLSATSADPLRHRHDGGLPDAATDANEDSGGVNDGGSADARSDAGGAEAGSDAGTDAGGPLPDSGAYYQLPSD